MNFFYLAVFFLSFTQVIASPMPPTRRNEFIVWAPRIMNPVKNSTWHLNTLQNVTWDVSDIPKQKRNANGTLILAHPTNDSENLDMDHPLARDFPLSLGYVVFNLTRREKGRNYAVCLLGDSGNLSEQFNIV